MSNEAHKAGIEAAARSDAAFDGRDYDSLGRVDKERYRARPQLALKAYLQASNQVLVPREPTEEMSEKGEAAFSKDEFHMSVYHCVGEAYKAMVEAAPKPFEETC